MTNKEYIRDGRAPVPVHESTSKLMRANKARNTKPELILRKLLWNNGLKGYRLHWKKVPGKPDITYPGKQLAIFVNGCFWHRCPHCNLPLPKSNKDFWKEKFERNIERDNMKIVELEKIGWQITVVWECQIRKSQAEVLYKITSLIK